MGTGGTGLVVIKYRREVKGESNAKTINCKWELVGLVWSSLK